MKLTEMMKQGFVVRGWNIQNDPRGERRVVFKLSKKSPRGEGFYVVHAPYPDAGRFKDMEFTAPVLVQ